MTLYKEAIPHDNFTIHSGFGDLYRPRTCSKLSLAPRRHHPIPIEEHWPHLSPRALFQPAVCANAPVMKSCSVPQRGDSHKRLLVRASPIRVGCEVPFW